MDVIIGGSPSSGSTLLQTILNNHPDIYAGPEFSIFDRGWWWEPTSTIEQFRTMLELEDYTQLDHSMCYPIKLADGRSYFGLASWGALTQELGGHEVVKQMAAICKDFTELFNTIRVELLDKYNAKIWVEKTPGNVYFINRMKFEFDFKTIVTDRDTYDIIASLIFKRKFDPMTAFFRYQTSTRARQLIKDKFYAYYTDMLEHTEAFLSDLESYIEVENLTLPEGLELVDPKTYEQFKNRLTPGFKKAISL